MKRTARTAGGTEGTVLHAARWNPGRDASRVARRTSTLLSAAAISVLVVMWQDRAMAGPVLPSPYIVAGLSGNTIGDLDPNTGRVTEIMDGVQDSAPGSAALNRTGTGQVSQPGVSQSSLSIVYGPASAVAASAYSAITGKANPDEKPAPINYEGYTVSPYGYYEGSALAELYFPLMINGPRPTATVDINAVLQIGGSGQTMASEGLGDASMSITGASGPTAFLDDLSLSGNQVMFAHEVDGVFSRTPVSFSTYTENGAYVLNTGELYEVELYAYADAGTFGSLTTSMASATGFASVDPTFTIDPGMFDADDYQILLGAGIGNSATPAAPASVPEPPVVALLFAGLAFVSTRARRAQSGR